MEHQVRALLGVREITKTVEGQQGCMSTKPECEKLVTLVLWYTCCVQDKKLLVLNWNQAEKTKVK